MRSRVVEGHSFYRKEKASNRSTILVENQISAIFTTKRFKCSLLNTFLKQPRVHSLAKRVYAVWCLFTGTLIDPGSKLLEPGVESMRLKPLPATGMTTLNGLFKLEMLKLSFFTVKICCFIQFDEDHWFVNLAKILFSSL